MQASLSNARTPSIKNRRAGVSLSFAACLSLCIIAGPATGRALAAETAALPAAKEEAIAGQVLAPDGSPIAGATISWLGLASTDTDNLTVLKTIKAGNKGEFRFDGMAKPEAAGRAFLMAEAKGYGFWMANLRVSQPELQIRLRPAAEVRLSFIDEGGAPAAGVRIRINMLFDSVAQQRSRIAFSNYFVLPVDRADLLTRVTDANGTCVFADMPQNSQLRVEVEDARFARLDYKESQADLTNAAVATIPPIRLTAAASVSGRITFGTDGKPAAGIRVSAQATGAGGWGEGVSDKDGLYTLNGLKPDTYNVALDLRNQLASDWTAVARDSLAVSKGAKLDKVDFQLIKGALVQGRVLAKEGGQPIKDVHIGIYGPAHPKSGAWVQGVITKEDGSYRMRVPGGEQYLYVMMSEAPAGYSMPTPKEHTFTIADGATRDIDFLLPPGPKLSPVMITVVGPDGKPVAGAEVEQTPQKKERGYRETYTAGTSDAEGKLKIEVRDPVLLRARKDARGTPSGVIANGSDTVTLTLTDNALASVTGRVEDETGQPIAGVQIGVVVWANDTGMGQGGGMTEADGKYTLSGLWAGESYSFSASARGYGSETISQRIKLAPGEAHAFDKVVLKKAEAFLAGRVVDSAGNPVANAHVSASGQQQMTRTDAEGRFRLENLVAGRVSLFVYVKNSYVDKSVQTGNENVVLVLSAPEKPDN